MRKSERQKQAQERDARLFAAGAQDELLRTELAAARAQKRPEDWAATVAKVQADAERPSSQYHRQALITMGALSTMGAA